MTLYRPRSVKDALDRTTSYDYYLDSHLKEVVKPEGNRVFMEYDARGNLKKTTSYAKPSVTTPDLVSTVEYESACPGVTCDLPSWTRDARNQDTTDSQFRTDYEYDATNGLVTKVRLPAPAAGEVRPETRYAYKQEQGVSVLDYSSACRTAASCVGTADETRTTYTYDANLNVTKVRVAAGDNSRATETSYEYDAVGNVTGVTDALGNKTTLRYNAARQVTRRIAPDPDGAGPRRSAALQVTYRVDGQAERAATGSAVAGATDDGFVEEHRQAYSYDAYGRLRDVRLVAGGTTYGVTQYGYDALGRPTCEVVRMNPAAWPATDAACSTVGTGASGPDRVTGTAYDAVGRVERVEGAVGTADAADLQRLTYTANGQVETAKDANGNVTTYGYDGHDRLRTTTYPGGSYEQLTLDAGGSVTSRRLRDGQVIGYTYDKLGRLVHRDRPNGAYWETDQAYSYDLVGNLTSAWDSNGHVLNFGWDALGRPTGTGDNWYAWGNLGYSYDAAGRRTRVTWAQDGFYAQYDYNDAGAVTAIKENGGTVLASYGYDDLGRRTSIARANGTVTSYVYDAAGRLSSLGQDIAGTGGDVSYGFGYNAAGQIASRTMSNDAYAWPGAENADRSYGVNALNQYTSAGGVSFGYDGRGNLTQSGSTSYSYTVDNQLATVPGAGLAYDPLGRLFNGSPLRNGEPNTSFAYDGDRIASEIHHETGNLLRRYVWGPGTDEPLVWYEGAGTGDRRFFHADERGSVTAITDNAGNATVIRSYDEYGIPSATTPANQGRFGYTGQAWLPNAGLWHYKARTYSPTLGRFLQTDPIGYADGMNWYNYVGGDPVNRTDPTGLCGDGASRTTGGECPSQRGVGDIFVNSRCAGGANFLFYAANTCYYSDNFGARGGDVVGSGGGARQTRPPAAAPTPGQAPKDKQCYGPPPGPRGISSADLARQARTNGAEAAKHSALDLSWFTRQVGDLGPWDYKRNDPAFEDFGNYNYGYTGEAQGIPARVLYDAAGFVQILDGTSSTDWFWSNWDDPEDQEQIKRGISDRRNGC